MRCRLLVTLIAVAAACAVSAPAAPAKVKWLCHPSLSSDPCRGDLTTRHFAPDGSSHVAAPAIDPAPAVDCFYVYPTVSNQPGPNAIQTADPEIRSIAIYQAQRFSARCRMFVPIYRQMTVPGLAVAGQLRDTGPYDTAYASVLEAWRAYMARDNGGRGFVLLGHSQGTRHLRALIRREIDGDPVLRARMISALIPGGNVTVARGARVGGDFANVPACDAPGQTGCVVAFSTFNETPPSNARYGRTDTDPMGGALGLPNGPEVEVLCTNPAALSGDGEALRSLVPSEPFAPGVIFLLMLQTFGGLPPSADTPWLEPTDHYTARCEHSNGANVLMLSPVGSARKLRPAPDATWGTHLVDVNIALGNLERIAATQIDAWLTPPAATG